MKNEEENRGSSGEEKVLETRRTRKREESRRRLLEAARELFVTKGYHDTRPQDIARAAGVGHGTFYLYFPDKRACFADFVDEACAELDTLVEARMAAANNFSGRIEAIIRSILDFDLANRGVLNAALSNPEVIAASSEEKIPLLERWGNQWADGIQGYMDRGNCHRDYDSAIIGQAIVGLLHQTTRVCSKRRYDRDLLVRNLTLFLTRALTG